MSVHSVTLDHDLYSGDLVALEFLAAVRAQEGDLTYGDATAVGELSFSTAASVSTMISEAEAFWTTGIADSGSTTAKSGLSSSTPFEFFDCFVSDSGGGTGTWKYSETSGTISRVTGRNFALAMRGLYARGGYSAKVTDVYSWLMAATSNPTYEFAGTEKRQQRSQDTKGEYEPTVCLATKIDVLEGSTAVNRNGSSYYDWAVLGILGPLHSARNLSAFRIGKRQAGESQRLSYSGVNDDITFRPAMRGKSGLEYQVAFTETVESASRRVLDVQAAATVGLAYRIAPVIFTQKDHP